MTLLVRIVFQCSDGERRKRSGTPPGRAASSRSPRDRLIDISRVICGHGLIGGLTILLIEQGAQLRFDLVVLFVGDVAEHIVHLVHHTALTSRGRKFLRNRIERGLVAIAHPQANLFDASRFEIVQQVFPGLFIFSITHA